LKTAAFSVGQADCAMINSELICACNLSSSAAFVPVTSWQDRAFRALHPHHHILGLFQQTTLLYKIKPRFCVWTLSQLTPLLSVPANKTFHADSDQYTIKQSACQPFRV
jgi:hypothetical protein